MIDFLCTIADFDLSSLVDFRTEPFYYYFNFQMFGGLSTIDKTYALGYFVIHIFERNLYILLCIYRNIYNSRVLHVLRHLSHFLSTGIYLNTIICLILLRKTLTFTVVFGITWSKVFGGLPS